MSTLRSSLFADGKALFSTGRLALAFRSGDRVFDAVDVEWVVGQTSALGSVRWTAPDKVEVDSFDLIDRGVLMETTPLSKGPVPLVPGMDFEYTFTVGLAD